MTLNNEWKKGAVSIIAAVVFMVLCFVSPAVIDGMDGGYALAFISLFLAISSGAVALLYIRRARVMDGIFADPRLLAHWSYTDEMSQKSREREYRDYEDRNRSMFIVIGGMLVLGSLFFIIFVEDGGLATGIILLVFAGFLFVVSRVAPVLERRRATNVPHEAFIARTGVIYEGIVYPFHSFLRSRGGITLRNADAKNPALLVFSFTQLNGLFILQSFAVTIPVPPGEEAVAQRIVRELGGDAPENEA
jgi:hypothetical protein